MSGPCARTASAVLFAIVASTAAHAGPGVRAPAGPLEIVDLSHSFGPDTVYWPTAPGGFVHEPVSMGEVPGGWFYSAFTLSTPEHGGTHLDAPYHFHAAGARADEVPLERLVAEAVVIDIAERTTADPDYRLAPEDIAAFEERHGAIPAGAILLVRTGWSARWPDTRSYLGDDRPGRTDSLHFPSFGLKAARILIEERGVAALGIDTASIDYGQNTDFPVHRLAAAHGVPGLENLTRLEALPPTGALLVALPMKIAGGSGAPLRAIALVPERP